MTKIETEAQYNWAMSRIEELLPFVNDDTTTDDPKYIELVRISNLVGDYEDVHPNHSDETLMASQENGDVAIP